MTPCSAEEAAQIQAEMAATGKVGIDTSDGCLDCGRTVQAYRLDSQDDSDGFWRDCTRMAAVYRACARHAGLLQVRALLADIDPEAFRKYAEEHDFNCGSAFAFSWDELMALPKRAEKT